LDRQPFDAKRDAKLIEDIRAFLKKAGRVVE
jgi:hypothetical protein